MIPLGELPAWAQVAIAFAVPINTALVLLIGRRSGRNSTRINAAEKTTRDLTREVADHRELQDERFEQLANGDDFPNHLR